VIEKIEGLKTLPGVPLWAKFFLTLVAAATVIVSIISLPGANGILAAAFALVALAIAVTDWHSFIIPNWLNAIGFGLGIFNAAVQEPTMMWQAAALAALRGIVLGLVFLTMWYGYAKLRGRQGIGLGDVKLAVVAGAWLDWFMIPVAIEIAVFAALFGFFVQWRASGRSLTATSRMPFGLFFAPAIWISLILETTWFTAV
jgi:leader peptidase (prepilin peptidase) / N-methyltransferase